MQKKCQSERLTVFLHILIWLYILLLEIIISFSGGRKNTSSLKQPITNRMSLFEIFINFSSILWLKWFKKI